MVKKNEPPGYPGDEAVKKAFGEALRELRLQKGLSLEQADALLQEASQQNPYPRLYRALGIGRRSTLLVTEQFQPHIGSRTSSLKGIPVH